MVGFESFPLTPRGDVVLSKSMQKIEPKAPSLERFFQGLKKQPWPNGHLGVPQMFGFLLKPTTKGYPPQKTKPFEFVLTGLCKRRAKQLELPNSLVTQSAIQAEGLTLGTSRLSLHLGKPDTTLAQTNARQKEPKTHTHLLFSIATFQLSRDSFQGSFFAKKNTKHPGPTGKQLVFEKSDG